jgi:hypothetical protein
MQVTIINGQTRLSYHFPVPIAKLALDSPKRNVQPGKRTHQDLASSVEPVSVSGLVDVLDVGGVPPDETFPEVGKGTFDCFRVTFQGGFSPSDDTLYWISVNRSERSDFVSIAWKEIRDLR